MGENDKGPSEDQPAAGQVQAPLEIKVEVDSATGNIELKFNIPVSNVRFTSASAAQLVSVFAGAISKLLSIQDQSKILAANGKKL